MFCGGSHCRQDRKKEKGKIQNDNKKKRREPSRLGMCFVRWGHAPDCLAVLLGLSIGKGA